MSIRSTLLRSIQIFDTVAKEYFEYLEEFLGDKAVANRIQRVERAIQYEKNQVVYLRYWLLPNASFWLGIKEARDYISKGKAFAGNISANMMQPIELAAKLRILESSMSEIVKREFRARIINGDYLAPVLYEINTAAHFWQLGYNIQWFDPPVTPGERVPEFMAVSEENQFEVECKSRRSDAGRRVLRPTFYRLVDSVAGPLTSEGFIGKILITLPGRLPTSNQWRDSLAEIVQDSIRNQSKDTYLDDGTYIQLDVHNVGDVVVPKSSIALDVQSIRTPYSNIAVFAKQYGQSLTNPLIVKVESQSKDEFLVGILQELRNANHQFTGQHSALICCFVAEIESFEGLGANSALANMTTFTFFANHANPFVFAVSYTSDSISEHTGLFISRSYPSITFENHRYDDAYGPKISIYAS